MKSLFWRNFIIYSLVIMFVFVLFGGTFIIQIDRYAGAEKQRLLENSAERASEITAAFLDSSYFGIRETVYKLNISQIAADNNAFIIVCDQRGNVIYYVQSNGDIQSGSASVGISVMKEVLLNGKYSARNDLNGIFKGSMSIAGKAMTDGRGSFSGAVFTAAAADNDIELLRRVTTMFFCGIIVCFCISLLAAYFVTRELTYPLKNIALATKSFAKGDFTARLGSEAQRRDEIGELAVNFNNMAVCLENTEQLRRGFIANVSHDLKTPMTTISGFIDGILDGTIPYDRQRNYLIIVSDEIKRLSRLAETMLEMSKIESGNIVLTKSTFDLCEVCRRIVLSFEQTLNSKNADVELDLPDTLLISADHDAIFRIIYNLTDNAVKFLNTGGKLRISISACHGFAEFVISNTGVEISKEDIPFVFDRFYKTDRSRGINAKGSGLGLFIVKSFVNLHNGTIDVKSDDGETSFFVKIPLI